ncbi:hypothetical protein [Cystobacter fuscus]|uniref:hypothetical protein n=1 Tax=Cystobacter fuscus TaxID=43 RepID=UPI0037C1793F
MPRDELTVGQVARRCIGCGCLSLKSCKLANPDDVLGLQGPGARKWASVRHPR